MDDTFQDQLDHLVAISLADIIIYSHSLDEHYTHVCFALQILGDKYICATKSKCDLPKDQLLTWEI